MEKEKIEIIDRYSATGTPYPDENSCDWCEGMGVSPLHKSEANKTAVEDGANGHLLIIGQTEQDGRPCEEDDYIFVRCPKCFGTRKKNPTPAEKLNKLLEDFGLLTPLKQ